jgi:hypothetical protein
MEQFAVVNSVGVAVSFHDSEDGARRYIDTRWRYVVTPEPYTVARVVLEPIPDPPTLPENTPTSVWLFDYSGEDGWVLSAHPPVPRRVVASGQPIPTVWSAVIPADAWEKVEG